MRLGWLMPRASHTLIYENISIIKQVDYQPKIITDISRLADGYSVTHENTLKVQKYLTDH